MTKFSFGDLVVTKASGMTGTVRSTADIVGIEFDNGEVALLSVNDITLQPTKPRAFSVGQYVRFDDGSIGQVIEDDGEAEDDLPYTVKEIGTNYTNIYDAEDLEPWKPEVGERVVIHEEPDAPGTVLAVDDNYGCTIKWDEYEKPQEDWLGSALAPFAGKSGTFKKGDKVVYVRGVLTPGSVAEVIRDEVVGSVAIIWDTSHWKYAGQINGIYPAACFDHYHEAVFSIAA